MDYYEGELTSDEHMVNIIEQGSSVDLLASRCRRWAADKDLDHTTISAICYFCRRSKKRIQKSLFSGNPAESNLPESFTRGEIDYSYGVLEEHPEWIPELNQIALENVRSCQEVARIQREFFFAEIPFQGRPRRDEW